MKYIIMFLITFILIACECNCDDDKDEIKGRYGQPEEINSYSSGGYDSESWWYWSKGIEFTFTSSTDNCCNVSKYKFAPIKDINLYFED